MSPPILWLIILIEGFVTISAEILTIRQLLPVVGNSVIVTSLIIGIFLLFLAYGYRRGGQYQDHYLEILKRNFSYATVGLGFGLSYAFIFWFFSLFRDQFHLNLLWALTAYLLLVTAPLVYILGQTVPITMNLIKQAETTGAIGGKILHLSTMGSFLGAVLTSLILMNYLGVGTTVVINAGLLMFLTLLLFSNRIRDGLRCLFLAITLLFVYRINITLENQLFILTNTYANYEVVTDHNAKILYANESPSSYLDAQNKAFPYIELIKRILFQDLKLTNKNILVLGAGGFTLTTVQTFDNRIVYVDIDKELKNIVEKNFSPVVRGEFVVEDARVYLKNTQEKFDAIVSDVYSSFRTIPAHLLTQEYFILVNQALNDSGIALFNIILRPTLEDTYSARMDRTIRSVFNHCMAIPQKYDVTNTNVIYVCHKNKNAPSQAVYTDNLNQITFDFFKSMSK